jgi:HEAT repeat protein
MATFDEYVAELIAQLDGPDRFHAMRTLNELGSATIPLITAAHARESIATRRAAIVETLWQFRDPNVMPTLAEALLDSDARVWKEALNGIVTLGGGAALDALARARIPAGDRRDAALRREWIDEAIEQVTDAMR